MSKKAKMKNSIAEVLILEVITIPKISFKCLCSSLRSIRCCITKDLLKSSLDLPILCKVVNFLLQLVKLSLWKPVVEINW
jgi:hypothetical protein